MEVAPKVHLVAIPDKDIATLYMIDVYLVGEREAILIDTGRGDEASNEKILGALKDLSAKLSYIVITHAHHDHFGGAKAISAATGAKIAVHEANAVVLAKEASSLKAEVLLQHGSILEVDGLKVEVVHTPGHSPGDICLYLRDGGVLFTGDTIVGTGTVVVEGDMVRYVESLKSLLSYDATMICPGHGPMVQDAKAKIVEIIDHRQMREDQIIAQLAKGNKSAWELVQAIYFDVDARLHRLAERNVLGHLSKLLQEGRVQRYGQEPGAVYALKR